MKSLRLNHLRHVSEARQPPRGQSRFGCRAAPSMRTRRLAFVISAVAVVLSATVTAYWQLDFWKSGMNLGVRLAEPTWNGVLCRARVYLQKARGGVSEFSWSELWGLMRPGMGFHCTEGSSLAASLDF